MSTYVCSDIHGQYELYARMFEEIQFTDNDHLYIIGDMIDRGPDGIRILQDAASRPNITCLIGNHEHMMWDYIFRAISGCIRPMAEGRRCQHCKSSHPMRRKASKNSSVSSICK